MNIQFISTKADKFTKETLFNFLHDEYNGSDINDNVCFIYSPAAIPNDINISNVAFARDESVSFSRIGLWWYETGSNEEQLKFFKKDNEDLILSGEHIFEL